MISKFFVLYLYFLFIDVLAITIQRPPSFRMGNVQASNSLKLHSLPPKTSGSESYEELLTSYEDALTKLWDGEDLGVQEEDSFSVAMQRISNLNFANISYTENNLKHIQILGGFDSGTNLVAKLLSINLHPQTFMESCPNLFSGLGTGPVHRRTADGHCFIWKHTPPWNVEQSLKQYFPDMKDLLLVAVVRSPLAHISGILKAPYDFKPCYHGVIDHHLQSNNCTIGAGRHAVTRHPPVTRVDMGSLMQAYNAYIDGYHQLKSQGANVLIIEYENIVMDTENTIRRVVEALGGHIDHVNQVYGPAKTHGQSIGHEAAVLKISKSLYMTMPPFNDTEVAKNTCKAIDTKFLSKHSFVADGVRSDYWRDCARV